MANILIVDDGLFIREMLVRILTRHGHTVVGEAVNGRQAVAMYKELRPDLVTMDITMPELDGVAALREIREFDPQAKVIMLSVLGQRRMMQEAIEAGAADFIVKPFHESRVNDAIAGVLGRTR